MCDIHSGGGAAGALTVDALMGGQVRLRQPRAGFRAAIDTVLLAAAVPARPDHLVFEAGAGCGAAALCLARRTGCRVVGIEPQPALVALAQENARLNGLADRVSVVEGAVGAALPPTATGPFDHAMANPPYLPPGRGTRPPHAGKAAAQVEDGASLALWVDVLLGVLKPRGTLTLVHRADRLDAVLAALAGRAGAVKVFPLWPKAGLPARRVIVRAAAGARTPLTLAAGLVLHETDGGFTPAADAALRGGALDF